MELANRAYSAFTVKSLDKSGRKFFGTATTPAIDRVGDSVNPLGVKFQNPLVLLHQHDNLSPIGKVWFDKPTKDGINFEAEIPEISEPATLRDRVETALGEIRHGLVRFVSIGFRPIKYAFTDDGVDYQETEVYELSTVSIPALSAAVISGIKSMHPLSADIIHLLRDADSRIKSLDIAQRSASGQSRGGVVLIQSPGVSGKPVIASRGAVKLIPRNYK